MKEEPPLPCQMAVSAMAIKSVGKPVVEAVEEERKKGCYTSLEDFLSRHTGKTLNKRTIENFIKAGAFDSLGGNRRQYMMAYAPMMERIVKGKKDEVEGQLSFISADFLGESEKQLFSVQLPDVEEYDKEVLLAYEKEVLGIYLSGHPLEKYQEKWRKNITAVTTDFLLDEETNLTKVKDQSTVVVGGMIESKTIKYTKHNQIMAFLTLEDLVGTLEVIVFPKAYDKNIALLNEEEKVFIKGKVQVEDEKNGKLICDQVIGFDQLPSQLWLQFESMEDYNSKMPQVYTILEKEPGADEVIIYLKKEKSMKKLPPSQNIHLTEQLLQMLYEELSEKNVKVVEKSIEIH